MRLAVAVAASPLYSRCAPLVRRIFSVKFSADANFVLSGSDDTNIRIWKAEASKSLAKVRPGLPQQVLVLLFGH